MNLKKRKRRSWFRRLLGKVQPFLGGQLGAALDVALAINDAIFSIEQKGDFIDINPTPQEELQAESILQTQAIPTINILNQKIDNLIGSKNSIQSIISELNILLKQIATLQAWVSMNLNTQNINVVDYMVASVIEPLLAKLNTSVTKVLDSQTNVLSTPTSYLASDISNVLTFNINWYNNVTKKTYQKLSYTAAYVEDVVIVASVDNPELSDAIETLSLGDNTNLPQKQNNYFGEILLGISVLFMLSKSSK